MYWLLGLSRKLHSSASGKLLTHHASSKSGPGSWHKLPNNLVPASTASKASLVLLMEPTSVLRDSKEAPKFDTCFTFSPYATGPTSVLPGLSTLSLRLLRKATGSNFSRQNALCHKVRRKNQSSTLSLENHQPQSQPRHVASLPSPVSPTLSAESLFVPLGGIEHLATGVQKGLEMRYQPRSRNATEWVLTRQQLFAEQNQSPMKFH
jgi:hypothetical protein